MFKLKSFKSKLRLIMTSILLLSIFSASTIFYVFAKSQINEKYFNDAVNVLKYSQLLLENTFSDAESGINIIIKRLNTETQSYNDIARDDFFDILSIVQENIENSSTLYFGLDNGSFYLAPKRFVADDYDPRLRPWYINSLENKETIIWSEPYIDHGTSELTISGSKFLSIADINKTGVVGIDILLSDLSRVIENSKIGMSGYVILLDQNGNILAHFDQEMRGQNIKNNSNFKVSTQEILKLDDTFIEDENYIYTGKQFHSGNIVILAIIDKNEIHLVIMKMLGLILMVTILFFLIIEAVVFRFSDQIIYPIIGIKDVMLRVENGDYDAQCEIKTNDEIQILINGFNNMILSINEKNIEMQALYEELYASEETLQEQYDSLYEQSEFIKKSEERYKLIFDASKEGLWDANEEWIVTYLTPVWYKAYFTSLADKDLKVWQSLIHPEDLDRVNDLVNYHVENCTEFYKCEYRVLNLKGEYRWIEAIGKAQFYPDGRFKSMSGSHLDITIRKESEFRIVDMAYNDYLTKIHNQLFLREQLDHFLEKNGNGAVLFIDLDNFKNINDTYGHTFGDYILIEVSKRLSTFASDSRVISRFSGDEFVIMLKHQTDASEIKSFVEALLNEINLTIRKGSVIIKVSASVGIAIFPVHGSNIDILLQNADIAMGQAKKMTHKSYYFFDDQVKKLVVKEMKLESALKNAVEKHEIILYYQPIIDIERSSIKGFEALARWNSAEFGLINPDDFIPLAERTGLINEIGYEVLKQACGFLFMLDSLFENRFEISVNISVIQLTQDHFVTDVFDIIDSFNMPYNRIILEITETIMLESDENILGKLFYLHSKGIKISLDDFGTGYSSVNNLIKLPLDSIKIDKSIMSDSMTNEHVYSLLESIVVYAHKMNYKVVGEGIENEMYLHKAKALIIDYAQGYYYSKPVDSEKTIELIKNYMG